MVAARRPLLPVREEGIPEELKNHPQWLTWRLEERNGEPTKVPYTPGTEQRASSTDPLTWSTFSETLAAPQPIRYDGIGFVFTTSDSFCGIDLDGCRDPEMGQIEEWATKVIETLDSYSEVSPSGEGVHIIVKGKLPSGRRKREHFECYDTGRFFTITGEHLDGTPYEIEERDEELGRLHRHVFEARAEPTNSHGPSASTRDSNGQSDQEAIARAMRAKNGEEFARLWAGELNGHASQSEADLALCSYLAFWTGGDPEAMDRLFRQSRLYHSKWDTRHYGDGRTYGQATIEKALEGAEDFYNPESRSSIGDGIRDSGGSGDTHPRLRSVKFNEIPDPGPRRYLLDGLIPEGYPTLLYGDGGTAKSMLALSFGLAMAQEADKKWLERDVELGGAVLYLDFELDAAEQRRRVNRLARAEGLEQVPDSFRYMSALGYTSSEALEVALEECKKYSVNS